MVEISLSGSGGGRGRAIALGYPTFIIADRFNLNPDAPRRPQAVVATRSYWGRPLGPRVRLLSQLCVDPVEARGDFRIHLAAVEGARPCIGGARFLVAQQLEVRIAQHDLVTR